MGREGGKEEEKGEVAGGRAREGGLLVRFYDERDK